MIYLWFLFLEGLWTYDFIWVGNSHVEIPVTNTDQNYSVTYYSFTELPMGPMKLSDLFLVTQNLTSSLPNLRMSLSLPHLCYFYSLILKWTHSFLSLFFT